MQNGCSFEDLWRQNGWNQGKYPIQQSLCFIVLWELGIHCTKIYPISQGGGKKSLGPPGFFIGWPESISSKHKEAKFELLVHLKSRYFT